MRHMLNFLYTPLGLPQIRHRLRCLILNFGVFFNLAKEQVQDQIATTQVEINELRAKALTDVSLLSEEERNRLIAEREVSIRENSHEIALREANIQSKRTDIIALKQEYDSRLALLRERVSLAEIERRYRQDVLVLQTRLGTLRSNITELQQQKATLTVGYRTVA